MKKRFFENLAFFAALNLLIKPVYVFGIDRVVQNTVGVNVYGTYFPLFNLVLIFQIFLDLGIENYTRKEISQNPGLAKRLFSSFLLIKMILLALFVSVFAVLGYLLPHNHNEWHLLFILIINQSLASLILFLRANMGGMHLFKAEGVASVLDRFTMILVCGTLLMLPITRGNFKIEWFVYAQTLAYFVTFLFSFGIVIKGTKGINFKINLVAYIPILKRLKPYAILVLLMAFYYRIDSVFLRYLLPDGKNQAGFYAHGFRILDLMANYALIFSFILLPTFAQMIRKNEKINSLLRNATITLVFPTISLLAGIAFYRYDVFQVLYPGCDQSSANIFLILNVSFIGLCISYTFGALLTANGNLKELIIMAIISVIISVVLNLVLIPRYKALGAAFSNAASQLFAITYHIVVATGKFKLHIDKKLVMRSVLFVVLTGLIGYLVSNTGINWLAGMLLISTLSVVLLLALRLVKIAYVIGLVKSYSGSKELST